MEQHNLEFHILNTDIYHYLQIKQVHNPQLHIMINFSIKCFQALNHGA